MENNKVLEVKEDEVEKVEEAGSSLEKGNYLIEVMHEGEVLRKMVVVGSEIKLSKMEDNGITIDLK